MYDEIYMRGFAEEDNDTQQEEQLIEGWAFCAEPRIEPKTIIFFGEEDRWDDQHQECPVCYVELGEQHETWCSFQDGGE